MSPPRLCAPYAGLTCKRAKRSTRRLCPRDELQDSSTCRHCWRTRRIREFALGGTRKTRLVPRAHAIMTRRHQAQRPLWSDLISPDTEWCWRGGKLFHRDAVSDPYLPRNVSKFRSYILHYFYATQNRSKAVRRSLDRLFRELGSNDWGLNLGAGGTRLHERLLNLDIYDDEGMDIVTRGVRLPVPG